jgi:phosphoserine phosphatase
MVVFDLDGTLTTVDSLWRYLHEAFGTWEQGQVAAQKYRDGEITYKEWAEADAKHWAGAPMPKVNKILDGIHYRDGAQYVFNELRQRGIKIVILSAGLSILADKAARELGADLAVANELRTNDGHLTGEIDVKVAVNRKEQIVREIAAGFQLPLCKVALVGDRAFDLANEECLKIAFMPQDEGARQQAHHIVETADLTAILQYLI